MRLILCKSLWISRRVLVIIWVHDHEDNKFLYGFVFLILDTLLFFPALFALTSSGYSFFLFILFFVACMYVCVCFTLVPVLGIVPSPYLYTIYIYQYICRPHLFVYSTWIHSQLQLESQSQSHSQSQQLAATCRSSFVCIAVNLKQMRNELFELQSWDPRSLS